MKSMQLGRVPIRILSSVAMILASLTMFLVPGSQAWAEINPGIKFSDPRIVKVDNNGNPVTDGGLKAGERATFSIRFDGTGVDVQPGDSFRITLPDYFGLREEGTFPIETDDKTPAGECVLKNIPAPQGQPWNKNVPEITCTFNEAIAGKHDIKGSLNVDINADDVSGSDSAEIDVNGKKYPTPLPGGAPISPNTYRPSQGVGKYAYALSANAKAIRWNVYAGGPWLNKTYQPGQPVVFVDKLGPGQKFALNPGVSTPALLKAICVDQNNPHGYSEIIVARVDRDLGLGFTLKATENADKTEARFEYQGQFRGDCTYVLAYDATFDAGAVKPGEVYENSGTFEGTNGNVKNQIKYDRHFKGTISYRDGFGSFQVTKRVQGDNFPQNQSFDVVVNYELPAGKTAASYPGWQAPPNPAKLTAVIGQSITFDPPLPEGTKVTLTEVVPAATDAGTWDGYKFASNDPGVRILEEGRKASFTIVDKMTTAVELTNTFTAKPTPKPTPSSSSSTPAPAPSPSVSASSPAVPPKPQPPKVMPGLPKTGS